MSKNNFHQQQQRSRTTAVPVFRGPASASSDQINNNNSSSTSSAATTANNGTVSQILMGTNPNYRLMTKKLANVYKLMTNAKDNPKELRKLNRKQVEYSTSLERMETEFRQADEARKLQRN